MNVKQISDEDLKQLSDEELIEIMSMLEGLNKSLDSKENGEKERDNYEE